MRGRHGPQARPLAFCDRTTREVLALVVARDGVDADDVRPRLCLDLVVSAFDLALRTWAAGPGEPDRHQLAHAVESTLARIPEVAQWAPPA